MKKITSYGQAVHYLNLPCGAKSIFGLIETKNKAEVTCKTCLKCIGVKNEGHGKGDDSGSEGNTDKT